ncbi:hypothetical protein Daus18300_007902 [Diaporthe australafricana]|uniref:Uncharacterized protein n=1 Tax=Diaporthe australafricana TaxID=127596 RepID=A0ABR3WKE8_9PEZI
MDFPGQRYKQWRDSHPDCKLVHVIWTDLCGILHEQMVSAYSFHNMYLKDVEKLPDAAEYIPLTVSDSSVSTLPDGTRGDDRAFESYETCELVPDYDTVQSNIDDRTHATVFAHVGMPAPPDPHQILKTISECMDLNYGGKCDIAAALQFQFVLRNRDDNKICNDPTHVGEKLVEVTSNHLYNATGLAISSCKILNDGVVTVQLEKSHDLLTAVDNFYRVKRVLRSIAAGKGLRLSFFYAAEDDPGAAHTAHSPADAVAIDDDESESEVVQSEVVRPMKTRRVPSFGHDAMTISNSPQLERMFLFGFQEAHYSMRKKEEEVIVDAVRSGRAPSAQALLENWY